MANDSVSLAAYIVFLSLTAAVSLTSLVLITLRRKHFLFRNRNIAFLYIGVLANSLVVPVIFVFGLEQYQSKPWCKFYYLLHSFFEIFINLTYLFRIIKLYLLHIKQQRKLKTQLELSLRHFLKDRNFAIAFIATFAVLCLYPIVEASTTLKRVPLESCNLNPYYELAITVICWLTFLFFCVLIRKKNDRYNLKTEFYGCAASFLFFAALFGASNYRKNKLLAVLCRCVVHCLYMSLSYVLPSVLTFFVKEKEVTSPDKILGRIIADEAWAKKFREHLEKEFSSENLEFYETVDGYKKEQARGSRKKRARVLFERFVKQGGVYQVNLPWGMVGQIEEQMKLGVYEKELFDAAQGEIFALMKRDSLRRFLAGADFVID